MYTLEHLLNLVSLVPTPNLRVDARRNNYSPVFQIEDLIIAIDKATRHITEVARGGDLLVLRHITSIAAYVKY